MDPSGLLAPPRGTKHAKEPLVVGNYGVDRARLSTGEPLGRSDPRLFPACGAYVVSVCRVVRRLQASHAASVPDARCQNPEPSTQNAAQE